ncbi:MAG: cyclic nucleotide-binding domain-containing protein [Luteolibacter sp.]|uniref:Crp/Fnr family transcriptional regulator n=1 Tax=Luteolibacter sp. TaxID=1962973 RepID=UPI003263C2A1
MESSHREFLTSFGSFLRPENGDVFIEEGAAQNCLHLILSGMLHVVTAAGERSLLVATLGAGDSLGEVNVFDAASASASVIARSECLIWRITGEELGAFFAADPQGGVQLMQGLLGLSAKRIRAMNAKLVDSETKASFHDFWKAGE